VATGVSEPLRSTPHSQKFRAVTAALVGIAIGATVIALTLLISGANGGPPPKWSDWSPTDGGLQGAREIAAHLAPLYRISALDQLAVVTVVNTGNAAASAVSGGSSGSQASRGLTLALRQDPPSSTVTAIGGNTIVYNLCGIGTTNCAIGGAPSPDRLLLLRREALELTLYTFKYVGGTQYVATILPPGSSQPMSSLTAMPPGAGAAPKPQDIALLFAHDELKPLLDQPLSSTLPLTSPPLVPQLGLWKGTTDAAQVAQITSLGLFSEHLSGAQDGSNQLVLEPLPPQ